MTLKAINTLAPTAFAVQSSQHARSGKWESSMPHESAPPPRNWMYFPMRLIRIVTSVMIIGASSLIYKRAFSHARAYTSTTIAMSAKSLAENAINEHKVMVFSKSYCPYCMKTKTTLKELGIDFGVFELDNMSEGNDIQAALLEKTGQRTVPNVFVNGKHVGGNDATQTAIADGSFMKLLNSK